jgi:large subunit ribosomal protein L4e
MKASVVGMDGSSKGNIELPKVFETVYKPVLIRRAVLAIQSAKKQPKGADPRAGKKNTALHVGKGDPPTGMRSKNVGRARLPRLRNRRSLQSGRVASVPQAVGGRRAHGPKAWKIIEEKINKKEKKLALASAIAATADKKLVTQRFIFEGELPLIVDDLFEATDKTKAVVEAFGKIGVEKDLENARSKVRKKAGKGKQRGRAKKVKKSVLIVTGKNDKVLKASRNLLGVEAVTVNSLNVELLAPGGEAGRLVIWTKGAIEALGEKKTKKAPKANKEVTAKKSKVTQKTTQRKAAKVKRKAVETKKKAMKAQAKANKDEEDL